MPIDRVTLREASERLGVSEGAIRKRVKRGTLRSELGQDGRRYVFLDREDNRDGRGEDRGSDGEGMRLTVELRNQLAYLRSQLDQEREANRENRRIIAALTSRIPEIEPPRHKRAGPETDDQTPETGSIANTRDEDPTGEPPRSWWARWLGG